MKNENFLSRKSILPVIYVLFMLSFYSLLVFKCGYRIPQKDKHPDWPLLDFYYGNINKLKLQTHGKIVIEGIIARDFQQESIDSTITIFLNKKGIDSSSFNLHDLDGNYKKNKPNIKIADSSVILDNQFSADSRWGCNMGPGSGRISGKENEENDKNSIWGMKFDHKSIHYFQVTIGSEIGFFKECSQNSSTEAYNKIFQCNTVRTNYDTLFFFESDCLFKAYVSRDKLRTN